MKRLGLVSVLAAGLTALVATSALGKGASDALIAGPGLGNGIALRSDGGEGSRRLGALAEMTGFYPSVFATTPNPMRVERPAGDLGPRYTITYLMPGPNGISELRQDVYPYAKPNPVTHTAAGQRYFGSQRTVGGWYVATATLKDELVAAGLPRRPPGADDGFPVGWTALGSIAVALAAIATFLLSRRRPATGRHATA